MIRCQFFDAGPWVHGFASNVLNLCNQRNLRIFISSGSGVEQALQTPSPTNSLASARGRHDFANHAKMGWSKQSDGR